MQEPAPDIVAAHNIAKNSTQRRKDAKGAKTFYRINKKEKQDGRITMLKILFYFWQMPFLFYHATIFRSKSSFKPA